MKAIKVFATAIITTGIFGLLVAFAASADASRPDRKEKCKCATIQQEDN